MLLRAAVFSVCVFLLVPGAAAQSREEIDALNAQIDSVAQRIGKEGDALNVCLKDFEALKRARPAKGGDEDWERFERELARWGKVCEYYDVPPFAAFLSVIADIYPKLPKDPADEWKERLKKMGEKLLACERRAKTSQTRYDQTIKIFRSLKIRDGEN